ncbi:MAG TPA: queuosine precursor transporter, partial [Anaerolineaceae bacterium]|nr:queuosine precursor transporter [Anaerolineaceae bacterium]
FVTVLLLSNIASSAKIVDWGVSLLGLRLAFDAGTILFPISYIFGDVLTEVYGYRRSRRVIWVGFGALALAVIVFAAIRAMPAEAQWQEYAGQSAYDSILGGMSSGGIALASLAAYFVGEFSNSFILAKLKILTRGRQLWVRTIGSTLVGEMVDTLVFIGIASLFNVFPWSLFLTLVVSNYIFKVSIEAIMTPVTYWVVNRLKKAEQEDYFDIATDFNPFKVAE